MPETDNIYYRKMEERILIVDDEEDIREILKFNLENAGYKTDSASSAEDALKQLNSGHRLILLDVMMGGMSGFEMAEELRRKGNETPIIFLTAKSAQNDLLTGFSSGGDDYIPKPFSIQEVLARIAAVLRRSARTVRNTEEPSFGDLKIDFTSKMVYVKGEAITFSKKEFELLSLLAGNPGKVFSRDDIIAELWKDAPYVLDRTIDVHIARIRSKLGPCKNYITNRSGFGYIFNPAN